MKLLALPLLCCRPPQKIKVKKKVSQNSKPKRKKTKQKKPKRFLEASCSFGRVPGNLRCRAPPWESSEQICATTVCCTAAASTAEPWSPGAAAGEGGEKGRSRVLEAGCRAKSVVCFAVSGKPEKEKAKGEASKSCFMTPACSIFV